MAELIRLRHLSGEVPSNRSMSLSRIVVIRTEIQTMDARHDDSPGSDIAVCRKYTAASPFRVLLRDTAIAWRKLDVFASMKPTEEELPGIFAGAWNFAVEVYDRMLLWPYTLPTPWQMKLAVLLNPPSYLAGLKPEGQISLYTSVQYGAIWIAYFCSRIHLCLSMLKARHLIQMQPHAPLCGITLTPSEEELENTITSTVDSILSSSPFLLGFANSRVRNNPDLEKRALGAFFLLRGLDVALTVPKLSPVHQRAILDILKRIGTEFGIKAALNRREEWLAENPHVFNELLH